MTAFDPMAPEVLDDPFPSFRHLHAQCPVVRHGSPWGDLWLAARHDDVTEVSRDHERWTATTGQGPRPSERVALFDDPPGHTRLRRIVQAAFSAPRVAALEPTVTALADELLDAVDGDRWDLHDALAEPLPVVMIARLLGVPEERRATFKHWSDEILAAFNDPRRGRAEREQLHAFFDAEVAARRNTDEPPDDLTTVLALTKDDEGERLTTGELWSVLVQLLIGGNETTTSAITNLVWRLLERRERWQAVVADPALIDVAVEESLRHDPPVLGLYRQAVDDTQLTGTDVPAGARMMMCYGAANRDPEVFDRPDEFRLDRDRSELRQHLAFGTGPHVCVGAALARLETRVALARLIERFPDLHLDGEPRRIEAYLLWGRRTLPVRSGP